MAFSSKRGDKSKKDASFCDLVDMEMFKGLADKVKRLEEKVIEIGKELRSEKERNEDLRSKNESMSKEMNRKDVELNEMAAQVNDLKTKVREMSSAVDNHQQQLSNKVINEEIIKQANNIVEKNKAFEESVDTVCTVKDEVATTYAQILKEKDEIKNKKQNEVSKDIKKEVKDIIRSNPKLIRETADMNKSIVIIGKKEDEIQNRITRDKAELSKIMKVMSKISEDITENDIEEYHRVGKYEAGKNRPIKVTFQSANKMEDIMKNAKNLKEEEEMKNIWIRRCLNKEDRQILKEKIEEARQINEARSEEEESLFFFKVVGLQVRKWYINKRGVQTA